MCASTDSYILVLAVNVDDLSVLLRNMDDFYKVESSLLYRLPPWRGIKGVQRCRYVKIIDGYYVYDKGKSDMYDNEWYGAVVEENMKLVMYRCNGLLMRLGILISLILAFTCRCLSLSSIQKGLVLSSNRQGQLNTIKADAKGSKEEIYSSRVKYMFKKDQPYIWVPEDDLHNVNATIDERSAFSVTTPFPGPLGSILKAMKKSHARVALTVDVIALKEKGVRLANEMIRESMLAEHGTISNSGYAVPRVFSSSNLGFTSRSECLSELLDEEVQYVVYKLDLRSRAFIDINGGTHDVDLELITTTTIDGINQSEIRRIALMVLCSAHLNANVRDAFLLSIDRTEFDIVGKVPSSKLNDCGSVNYQWKEFRIPLKQEARDIGTFCEQLVFLDDHVFLNVVKSCLPSVYRIGKVILHTCYASGKCKMIMNIHRVAFEVVVFPVEVRALNSNGKGLFQEFVDDTKVKMVDVGAIEFNTGDRIYSGDFGRSQLASSSCARHLIALAPDATSHWSCQLTKLQVATVDDVNAQQFVYHGLRILEAHIYAYRWTANMEKFHEQFIMFSSLRPPEVADLEDKVNFMGRGMLRNGILGNLREVIAIDVISLVYERLVTDWGRLTEIEHKELGAEMASTYSSATFQSLTSCKAHSSKPASLPRRRQLLFLTTSGAAAATLFAAGQLTAKAEDIGLFGIRKRIKEVEKEAEEIVEAAEKEVGAAEEEIIENAGGFAQAGVVAGAEVLGVFVASSVVNGILGPEGQKS
ncbi:unnamed protein product [Rhodiola kirilowii]